MLCPTTFIIAYSISCLKRFDVLIWWTFYKLQRVNSFIFFTYLNTDNPKDTTQIQQIKPIGCVVILVLISVRLPSLEPENLISHPSNTNFELGTLRNATADQKQQSGLKSERAHYHPSLSNWQLTARHFRCPFFTNPPLRRRYQSLLCLLEWIACSCVYFPLKVFYRSLKDASRDCGGQTPWKTGK